MLIAGGRRVRVELSAEPTSAVAARRLVQGALDGWQLQHLSDTATLLVSELAANVVLHAGTSFLVEAERRGENVRISVFDCSTAGLSRRRYGPEAGTGRGLALIDVLATSWGTSADVRPWAKVVWFELATDPAALPEPGEGALLDCWSG
ncbi:MAG: ATP-binding protein [Actinobacteria bacterium]|nr:ATP-binding protein [Actinomycetota bacterium]MBW3646709.1 ATP-binding protein [Actinomycetota bacterium]